MNWYEIASSGAALLFLWSWQSSLLIALTFASAFLFRRFPADARYKIWFAGIAASAFLPLWTLICAMLPAGVVPASARLIQLEGMQIGALMLRMQEAPVSGVNWWGTIAPVIFTAWLAGMAVCGARYFWHIKTMRRLVGNSGPANFIGEGDERFDIPSGLEIRTSAEVSNVILAGFFRPVILLPENAVQWLSGSELAAVARHEIAHFHRRDHLFLPLLAAVKAFFFFHPFVRYALSRIELERELACDEAVLDTGVSPDRYSKLLLKIAERDLLSRERLQPAFTHKKQLTRRINKIMSDRINKLSNLWRYLLIAETVALLAAVVWFATPERVNGNPFAGNAAAVAVEDTQLEAEFKALYERIREAILKGDKEFFESQFADDYSAVSPHGDKVDKKKIVERHMNLPDGMKMEKVEFSDLRVVPEGDRITVSYKAEMAATMKGETMSMKAEIIDTWEKRDGKWLSVSSKASGVKH